MNRQSLLALAAATAGTLVSSGARATITDSLTGPDTSVVRSALTSSTPNQSTDANSSWIQNWSFGGNGFGNSRFGASYQVESFTGAFNPNQSEGFNYFSASATALGDTRDVLAAGVYGMTDGNAQTATTRGYIVAMGNFVRDTSHAGGRFNGTYFLNSLNQKLYDSGTQTFYIGFIPVSVGARVNVGGSQSVSGYVWLDGVAANFNEGFGVTVTAFGGIGPSWANAGVKVNNLSLFNASLNLAARGTYLPFSPTANACIQFYQYGASHSVRLTELSGQLALYASAFGFSDDYTIASWPGFVQNYTVGSFPNVNTAFGTCFPSSPAPTIQGVIIG